MSSWSIASMKKSILFDVLNVIDKANREKDYERITFEYSLLKRDTFLRYNNLFELAKEFDDSIAAVLYIPENDKNINRWTVLLTVFLDKAKEVNSFMDLIDSIETADKQEGAEPILRECLYSERKIIPEDLIPAMIQSRDMYVVKLLDDTALPQEVKYSLATLLFNYSEFVKTLVAYLNKIHDAVGALYDQYKDSYRYTSRILRNYLESNNIEKLLPPSMQEHLLDVGVTSTKYVVVLLLIRLEYIRIVYEGRSALHISGLFYIQRMIHNNHFKIF